MAYLSVASSHFLPRWKNGAGFSPRPPAPSPSLVHRVRSSHSQLYPADNITSSFLYSTVWNPHWNPLKWWSPFYLWAWVRPFCEGHKMCRTQGYCDAWWGRAGGSTLNPKLRAATGISNTDFLSVTNFFAQKWGKPNIFRYFSWYFYR